MHPEALRQAYDTLRAEATQLAGGLTDLAQRATVYHHVYQAAGGNHIFPLIAAHGALWAGGYFRRALALGHLLVWQYGWSPALVRRKLAQLDAFANAFRDINRRVCIDIYTNFHFTRKYGNNARAAEFLAPELFQALNRIHAAQRAGRELTDAERLAVFEAHFLNEQTHIVGPAIASAIAEFDWPLVRYLALRPRIDFAYFPAGRSLRFRNFAVREERVEKGLEAFALARAVGWQATERALGKYALLPPAFFANSTNYFVSLRESILAAA